MVNNKSKSQTYKVKQLKKLLGLKKQVERVHSAILEIADSVSTANDLEHFYFQLHEIIASLVRAPNLFIIFRNSLSQTYEFPYYASQDGVLNKPLIPDSVIDMGLTGYLLREKTSLLCTAKMYNQLVDSGEIIELGAPATSWLGVTLQRENGDIGALVIASYSDEVVFSEHDLKALELLSLHVTHAIDRVTRQKQMEREITSRTQALFQTNQKLKAEVNQHRKYQQGHKLLLELAETHDFSKPLDFLYHKFSDILVNVFEQGHYFIQYNRNTSTWRFPNANAMTLEDISRKYQPINEYLVLDPQSMVFGPKEIQQLIALNALIANGEQKKALLERSWLSAPVKVDEQSCLLLVLVKPLKSGDFLVKDADMLGFLATHFKLMLQRWESQQAILSANDKLENTIYQRTQDLHDANADLQLQIEERKKAQDKLYHDANHDTLTGLPNRQLFNRKLMHAVACATMDKNYQYSVLFIDLDRFKLINDTFGHLVGDRFLVEVSQRILSSLSQNDVLARLGGDEFVILLQQRNAGIEKAQAVACQIIQALSRAFEIDGFELYAGCSIGITGAEQKYDKPTNVLRDADTAMYRAKNLGRGRYVVFDQSLHLELVALLNQETELRKALKDESLDFVFQPIINLQTGEVAAVESLVRWHHPEKGVLKPVDFLPMAQDTGLIQQIDAIALKHACEYLRQRESSQDKALVSVNISSATLYDDEALQALCDSLSELKSDSYGLILEFAEKGLTEVELCIRGFERLRQCGARVALDDFGSESGSMGLLFSGEIDFVKVDERLIKDAENSIAKRRYTSHLVAIGQEQGFIVIAEGIENEAMRETAIQTGCVFAQGQLLAATVSREDLFKAQDYYFNKSRKLAM
ncbi:sensor domain-containing phosphodiesterase [Catenovulum sediminis]|uniref:EAL domain-containing protein n=1 Tax=Catenovulum sediminis TaxID=1740262 RepID=A0ABV1RGG1_9ALTE